MDFQILCWKLCSAFDDVRKCETTVFDKKMQITRKWNHFYKNDLSWILLRPTVGKKWTNYYNQTIEVETKLFINKTWQVALGFEYMYI